MRAPFYQIDAFADRAFAGNPAGVVPLDRFPEAAVMQAIAAEINLAETAFFVPRAGRSGEYDIRWFTPTTEGPLCGHATLASAFVVTRYLSPDLAAMVFHSQSGPLPVARRGDKLELDFPARQARKIADRDLEDRIVAAIGRRPIALAEDWAYIAEFAHAAEIAALVPDFAAFRALDKDLIVTAPGEGGIDFVSRFFAPKFGIPEDPVTGAAHCLLAPYWAQRFGRADLRARQLSARGGDLWLNWMGERVKIAGTAIPVIRGEIEF